MSKEEYDEFGEELYKEYLYFEYEEKYEQAKKEIERLNNVLKEAIEYIEENTKEGPIKDKKYFYSPEQANELLDILNKKD